MSIAEQEQRRMDDEVEPVVIQDDVDAAGEVGEER